MLSASTIFLVLLAAFLGAVATFCIKRAVDREISFFNLISNTYFWSGLFIYAISIIPYFIALRQEELSALYPFVATTYIWSTFLSVIFLREKLTHWKLLGLVGIIIGVIFIGIGS